MERHGGDGGDALGPVVADEAERVAGPLHAARRRDGRVAVEDGQQGEGAVVVGAAERGGQLHRGRDHQRERLRQRAGEDDGVGVDPRAVVEADRPGPAVASRASGSVVAGPEREREGRAAHVEARGELLGEGVHPAPDRVRGGEPSSTSKPRHHTRTRPSASQRSHPSGERLGADGEELRAVVERRRPDAAGRQTASGGAALVQEDDLVAGLGQRCDRP